MVEVIGKKMKVINMECLAYENKYANNTFESYYDVELETWNLRNRITDMHYPMAQHVAEALAEELKEIEDNYNLDFHQCFTNWDNRINWLNRTNRRLADIDEIYSIKSDNLLTEARKLKSETGEDIISNKYGGNNDKTRKKYIKEQLADLLEEKKELEFLKEHDNRVISFLKKQVDLKLELLKYD